MKIGRNNLQQIGRIKRIKKQSLLTIKSMQGLSGSMLFYVNTLSASACYQCYAVEDMRSTFYRIEEEFQGVDMHEFINALNKLQRGEYAI